MPVTVSHDTAPVWGSAGLTWSILLFAVFTGLSALAQGFVDLGIYRFVAGIGIGGEFGIGMMAAEAVPPGWRPSPEPAGSGSRRPCSR